MDSGKPETGENIKDDKEYDESPDSDKPHIPFDKPEFRLYAAYPSSKEKSAAHTIGRVVLDRTMNFSELVTVLCDTGALSANFIAKNLIKKFEKLLKEDSFFNTKCRVTLADSRTVKDINKGVKLKLIINDKSKRKYVYTGDFFILDMENNDIILGLPALTGKLYPFMQAILRSAHENSEDKGIKPEDAEETEVELSALDLSARSENKQDLKQPFSKPNDKLAPEDEDTPLPVNFGEPLAFLGKSREEGRSIRYFCTERMERSFWHKTS